MARIKIAYIGGGSTRAPGTLASFIEQGKNFAGSEIVLIDLNKERLELVKKLADKMAQAKGVELEVSIAPNQRDGLRDAQAVLSSFRPGGFEARHLDESIPLKYGVIGQETQGPGGFFMALRAIKGVKSILKDMEDVCPGARLFNYTNPVNIVAEAVTHHSDIPTVSLCEGPIIFPREIAAFAELDPDKVNTVMIGLNHASWSVRHRYGEDEDFVKLVTEAFERKKDTDMDVRGKRLLELTATMGSVPAQYYLYYYYRDEILQELTQKSTTRAEDIMASVPDYWRHYREQAERDNPQLDPNLSRGGINELELAIDVMDAFYNHKEEVWTVNVPNQGAVADLPDDMVVEVPGLVDGNGITPIAFGHLPKQVAGLTKMLGEYQALTAEAAWSGTRRDAVQALTANPLVLSLPKAEALYDEMSSALKDYLPERLLR